MGFFLTAGICDETNCRTGAGFRSAAVPAGFRVSASRNSYLIDIYKYIFHRAQFRAPRQHLTGANQGRIVYDR
jgi:hypothetical protein